MAKILCSEKQIELPRFKISADVLGLELLNTRVWHIEERECIPFTEAWATRMLKTPHISGDRRLRSSWVNELARKMMLGEFNYEHVQHLTASVAGERKSCVRINGQHTSLALIAVFPKLKKTGMIGKITHIHYLCKDREGLRKLYTTVDQSLPRHFGDKLVALLADEPMFQGQTPGTITKVAAALAYYKLGGWRNQGRGRFSCASPEISAAIVKEMPEVVEAILPYLVLLPGQSRYMHRKGTLASMAAMYEANPSKYREFWDPIYSSSGFEGMLDPRVMLQRFQISVLVDAQRMLKEGENAANEHDLYKAGLHCWNAWMDGKTLSKLSVPKEVPEILK